jgi:hypothetical protein
VNSEMGLTGFGRLESFFVCNFPRHRVVVLTRSRCVCVIYCFVSCTLFHEANAVFLMVKRE